jgi:hypothetical protein
MYCTVCIACRNGKLQEQKILKIRVNNTFQSASFLTFCLSVDVYSFEHIMSGMQCR